LGFTFSDWTVFVFLLVFVARKHEIWFKAIQYT